MTDSQSARIAVISTDAVLREVVRSVVGGPERRTMLAAELVAPLAEFDDSQIQALRQSGAKVVILDLSTDAEIGLRLAHFLAERDPQLKFIGVGPTLGPELLMAAMRAGMSDFVPKPAQPQAIREAIDRALTRLGGVKTGQSREPGQVLAVFSPKGGSGTTTVAANLGIVLHRLTGRKTLLVDLDLELGETAVILGVQPRFNFVDFVENFRRMDADLLASYIEQHPSGVHLLSAPFQPEKAEAVTAEQIRRILAFLRQHYDYVVVDTPKSFGPATLAAFEQSETVFLVSTVDLPSLRNLQRALPMLRRVLPRGEEQIRLVVNRYNPNDAISLKDVEQTLLLKPFATLANDYEAVSSSVNTGKPIVLNGNSAYSRDIKTLAALIAGLAPERKSRGLTGPLRNVLRKVVRKQTGE